MGIKKYLKFKKGTKDAKKDQKCKKKKNKNTKMYVKSYGNLKKQYHKCNKVPQI